MNPPRVYPISVRRIMWRLGITGIATILLGVYSTPSHHFTRILAHVVVMMMAGGGVVYISTFPLIADRERHRGVLRFIYEEVVRRP